MIWLDFAFWYKDLGNIFLKLIKLLFYYSSPLRRIWALHYPCIDFRHFNIKLCQANKIVQICYICKIDNCSQENFQLFCIDEKIYYFRQLEVLGIRDYMSISSSQLLSSYANEAIRYFNSGLCHGGFLIKL